MEKFDKTKFTVNFDSIFSNKKMGSTFYKFLQSEHNSEAYDFLMDVFNLETAKEEKHQIEKAKHIFITYINEGSTKEINISGELRAKTISTFKEQTKVNDKWILEMKATDLFLECFQVMSSVLRHDPFKRFIRTDECENVMKQFQNDTTVIFPSIRNTYSYEVSDFRNRYIDDKDFDFFKALMEDGYNWHVRNLFLKSS
jgi:hypothetical protein